MDRGLSVKGSLRGPVQLFSHHDNQAFQQGIGNSLSACLCFLNWWLVSNAAQPTWFCVCLRGFQTQTLPQQEAEEPVAIICSDSSGK